MLSNMNGEVNGTTEEPMEVSSPKEEDTEPEKNVISEKFNLTNNSNVKTETDHLDSELEHSNDGVNNSSNNGELYNGLDHKHKDEENSNLINSNGDQPSPDVSTESETNETKTGDQKSSDQISETETNSGDNDTEHEESVDKPDTETINEEASEDPLHLSKVETEKLNKEDIEGSSDSEPHVPDTVSIHSDSEDLSNDGLPNKSNDVIVLENESPNGSEIQEIESENDCVVTVDTKNDNSKQKSKVEPRRSARSSKRIKYDDDYDIETESDVELIADETVKRKSKQIIFSDTKKLVDIVAKHGKGNKKEPTVVFIDSPKSSSKSATLNASFYQSIVARGTTVTPIKSSTSAQASQAASSPTQTAQSQPNILPSLTDDMFVVEAPSFIVPYVYEKPSVKPFREFVDKLGKELEEQKEKEEKEKLEKKKQEKAKREQERKEKREKGEEVDSSENENEEGLGTGQNSQASELEALDAKKKKAEKKERRRRKKEDDDVSWDGSESDMSDDDETISDEEGAVEILKQKSDIVEEIKGVSDLDLTDSVVKSDNYFDCSLGKFFTNIGINLVKEYVQTDLIKQQTRKLQREKKSGHSTREREITIAALMKNLELSKENNEPYKYTLKKCDLCSFKTESDLVLANHLQTPHMKNNVYRCNFCPFQIKSPHDILFHMEAEHNVKARLERAASYHQCPSCPFEDNGKGKLGRHLIACAKKFKPEQNMAPPLDWEPPAKIPKLAKARNSIVGSYPNNVGRSNWDKLVSNVGGGSLVYSAAGRQRAKNIQQIQPRGLPISGSQIIRSGIVARPPAPISGTYAKGKSVQHPSISITPLPRQPAPIPVQSLTPQNAKNSTFVICEICDGYIKDLEQLRNHMQWIHKVKIHPKMIYNRPPLNCQKCQFRFFTDQGLERHLLGSHGLVTSSMQEAANKGKDAGRCPVCGRVYQWKLLNHVARDHNLTLKPAHLSYKCTVCTATFGMYKQFENHVYSAHSVVAKRVMDKNKPAAAPTKTAEAAAKALKINDEITITAQPAAPSSKDK